MVFFFVVFRNILRNFCGTNELGQVVAVELLPLVLAVAAATTAAAASAAACLAATSCFSRLMFSVGEEARPPFSSQRFLNLVIDFKPGPTRASTTCPQ